MKNNYRYEKEPVDSIMCSCIHIIACTERT